MDLDPSDCWGAHAVAHVLTMQGRLEEGVAYISALTGNWDQINHIRHHFCWHLALFHMERGDQAAALDIYDTRLRDLDSPLIKSVPDFYVDIQNDVAVLQRLELRGVDVGERWDPIAELACGRINNHTSPFTSPHCVLALAAAGWDTEAEECVRSMRSFVTEDGGAFAARYALAALPASEAALAYRRGEHARVIEIMGPARRNLWQMGGSHAQRDLFFQIYADSAHRLDRHDVLSILFDDLRSIVFEHITERSSYADSFAALR